MKINIIPKPKKIVFYEDTININETALRCEDSSILGYLQYIGNMGEADSGTQIEFCRTENLYNEQYEIRGQGDKITVNYGTAEGAFRAVMTLKQVLDQAEQGKISGFWIKDEPDLKNRGLMIDISRGKVPKLSELKKMVDVMAMLKYNQLQLYVETFVYQFKNFKEYCQGEDVLSEKDFKELEAYCKERFISLVPNINSFGHMDEWLKKEELSHLSILDENGKTTTTLNPLDERSLTFIEKMYDGYLDIFETNIANIGMDEPDELGKGQTKEACEKYGKGRIFVEYLNKVCTLVTEKYKKTPMFWDDVVMAHEEQLKDIPKSAIVLEWGYEQGHAFQSRCSKIQNHGLRYYVCPGTSMWQSITGRTNNAVANMTSAAKSAAAYGGEGFLLTEWGDFGHSQFLTLTYLPIAYGGAISWNCGEYKEQSSAAMSEEQGENLEQCKAFLDRYVYDTKEGSLADIVYRMGNYYLLEEPRRSNTTDLFSRFLKIANSEVIEISQSASGYFAQIAKYMEELREELRYIVADENTLREVRLSSNIVIALAKYLSNQTDDTFKAEIENIIQEYDYLWKLKNKEPGVQIFEEMLSKLINS